MDALFRLPNNDLSAALQKDKLFKEVEQQWNTVSSEEGNSRRKVDYEIYKSIVYNLEVRKVFLDPKLSLVKFSSIVGTNTTYLSNVVNHYFKCNFKHLLNKCRVKYAKLLLDKGKYTRKSLSSSVDLHPEVSSILLLLKKLAWSLHGTPINHSKFL